MKLLRFGPLGTEKPGILDQDGSNRDLSGTVSDISGATLADEALEYIRATDLSSLPLVSGSPRITESADMSKSR